MSLLLVNGQVAERYHDPDIPLESVAKFVADAYGPDATYSVVLTESEQSERRRKDVRARISQQAGDPQSLLGSTADGTALLLYEVARLVESLNSATTLADVRSAAQPLAEVLGDFRARVDSGQCQLPYRVKGGSAVVLPEIDVLCSAVSEVIASGDN